MKKAVSIFPFIMITIIFFTFSSCKKECTCGISNAEIIGFDYRECVCCGGWEMVIDDEMPPDGISFFLVAEFPSSFKIGDNPQFPILVKIDYTIDTSSCFGYFVKVNKITKQ